MGGLVMPFQEQYNADGHFTTLTKITGTLKTMGKVRNTH